MANTGAATANPGNSRVQDAFDRMRKCITLFGAVSAVVLGTVAVVAFTGHGTTSFLWVRGAVLLALAPLLHRFTVRAQGGSYKAFERVRTLSAVMPVAIIGVDLIPGLCPPWYGVLQGLSAPALIGVAVLTRGSALRAAFPTPGKGVA